MGINWQVRLKSKAFWLAFIPAVLLLIQQVLAIFGVRVDFTTVQQQLIAVVGTMFALLAMLGIVVDPTTEGIADSERAMGYTEPHSDFKLGKHAGGDDA